MAAALRGRGDCGRGLHPCAGQRLPGNPDLLGADVCRRVLWAEGGRGDRGSPGFGAPSCAVSLWDPESGLRCELRTGLGLPLRLLQPLPRAVAAGRRWLGGPGGDAGGRAPSLRAAGPAAGCLRLFPSLRAPVPEDGNSVLFFRVSPEPSLGQGPRRGWEVSAGLTGYGSVGAPWV